MAILDVQHIEKSFGATKVLKDINFSLPEGQVLAIIGSSGSGKTTLLRCLNFLETPDKGSISVRGETLFDAGDPATQRESEIRRKRLHFGLVFQNFNLFPQYTALENVTLARELMAKGEKTGESLEDIRAEGRDLLTQMGLQDRMGNYPHQLSGGQQQRVAIARALASDPKVLLCDEATSALDPQTTESILNLLRDINKRLHITIVMITHQMNVVKEICDRVAVIENGEIIEQGSMVDIFTNPQKATTREFVASIQHNDLPDFVRKLDIHKDYKAGDKALVSLSFIGDSAGEPIVSVLIKEYDTNVNILTANIENLQDTPFGTLLIEVEGDEAHLKKALDYLHERKVKDEVIGYVS